MDKRVLLLLEPGSKKVIHTHISVVFIKDDIVYKVKKPVNFGFLDFSTLEKRHFYCEREVELNRRLCPEIYLGVEPIVWNEEIIDYAVVMKPIPEELTMKRLIKTGELTETHIERVIKRIAQFHREAETNSTIASFGRVKNFKKNTDENFEQTRNFIGKTIDEKTYDFIRKKTEDFYKKYGDLIDRRAEEGFVKDCHGDLHTDHIVLTDNICIFDCIEFNDRFRYIDVACDIAFLLMDLDFLGAKKFSQKAQELYIQLTADQEAETLLPLFKSYRAYVRGKVNSFISADPNISEDEKRLRVEEARRYFNLARSYLEAV